jgi:serine/threonine protein kinase
LKGQVEQIRQSQQVGNQRGNSPFIEKPVDPYLGYLIRGYCLEELLGRGKVTSLYRARTEELWMVPEVIMTLLRVPKTFSSQMRKSFIKRFLYEAEQIVQLRHPALLPLFGYGEEDGLPYLIVPTISGVSLAVYLKRQQRWSPSEVLAILQPIANGLTYIHSRGLVYQFLNPTNILLRRGAPPQITGLRLAQILCMAGLEGKTIDRYSYSHLKNIAGGFLGAVEYLAPEVVRDEEADPRSDVYSLGVILFEMLSGKPSFTVQSYLEGAQKLVQEPASALFANAPDFPPALKLVVKRALHGDPDQRFQTPDELIAAYSDVLDQQLAPSEQAYPLSGNKPLPRPPKNIWSVGQPRNRVLNSGSVRSKRTHQPLAERPMQAQQLPGLPKSIGSASQVRSYPPDTFQRGVAATPITRGGLVTDLLRYTLGNLPLPMQRIVIAILARSGDSDPEELYAGAQQVTISSTMTWGWLPMLTLTNAFGADIVSCAFNSSRYNGTGLDTFFLLGLFVMVAPVAVRLLLPTPSRFERIGLLYVLGLCLYLVKIMTNPLYFTTPDEFLHWRTAQNIARTRHLFNQNSLLPVSPYYPGLEIVTNAFSTLSGLNIFYSGRVVIAVVHLLMILSLFIINEQITKSPRVASIATMIYMANSQFLLFDAGFIYESFALPLAAFMVLALGPCQLIHIGVKHAKPVASSALISIERLADQANSSRWLTLAVWIALAAMSLTHHVTSFFFDLLLLCWAIIDAVMHRTSLLRSMLAKIAAFALIISITNILHPGNPIISYLFLSDIKQGLNQLGQVLAGTAGPRRLFDYGGTQPIPIWDRMLIASALVLPILCIPFGWLCLWQRYRSNTLAVTFGVLAFFYSIIQSFRLTPTGIFFAVRSTAFLFIPVAFLLAIFITQFWPTRDLCWRQMVLVTSILLLLFLGGGMTAAGDSLINLPGPYGIMANGRSIEPEGIQAAIWASSHLKFDSRMGTDLTNQLLMGTYGGQDVVTPIADNIDLSPIFFSLDLNPNELSLLDQAQVRYLVVDLRLTRSLPTAGGIYYANAEPEANQHTIPIDVKAMTKFSTMPSVNTVFDSGNIIIYDVGGLLNASQKH